MGRPSKRQLQARKVAARQKTRRARHGLKTIQVSRATYDALVDLRDGGLQSLGAVVGALADRALRERRRASGPGPDPAVQFTFDLGEPAAAPRRRASPAAKKAEPEAPVVADAPERKTPPPRMRRGRLVKD